MVKHTGEKLGEGFEAGERGGAVETEPGQGISFQRGFAEDGSIVHKVVLRTH